MGPLGFKVLFASLREIAVFVTAFLIGSVIFHVYINPIIKQSQDSCSRSGQQVFSEGSIESEGRK